jgi:hypothetical protein
MTVAQVSAALELLDLAEREIVASSSEERRARFESAARGLRAMLTAHNVFHARR